MSEAPVAVGTEVVCTIAYLRPGVLTRGKTYAVVAHDVEKRQIRVCGDNGRTRWYSTYYFDLDGTSRAFMPYDVWVETDHCEPGSWDPHDTNTDVIVTFADRSRWVVSFFTYANIATLAAKNRETGECLAGKYYWSSDMALIDEVSRARIEEVIAHLIAVGDFESVFTRLPDHTDEEDEALQAAEADLLRITQCIE